MELPTSQKLFPRPAAVLGQAGRGFWEIAKAAATLFARRSGGLLAGAVAFFSLLSVIPILFIALSIAKLGAREATAHATLIDELARWIGPSGAATVSDIVGRTAGGASLTTRLLHPLVLVYMSTRLFSQLRKSINHLWYVEAVPGGGVRSSLRRKARRLVMSFFVVVVIEVILLALVAVKTGLAVMSSTYMPGVVTPILWRSVEIVLTFGVVTLLFATMFRFLPDARIAWRDLWVGALVTAFLFSAGATLVSLYLGHKSVDDEFGDGGAVVMLLLWVNYSAQIFFFGVAFTGVWADRKGGGIRAVHGARRELPAG